MRKIRWGAAVGAALLVSIPVAAEAATPTAPTTSTSAPSTSTSQTSTSAPSTSTSTQSPTAPKSASTTTGTTTTPAPAGTSEAYALVIGNILALSHTKASASGSGTSSTADPLELGGNPPASQFGGTQNGPGSSGSALFDTGNQSNQFRLALLPWTATNSQSPDGSQSTADAMSDIVLLDLGTPGTSQSASVRVLQSQSHATWTPAASSGNSSADGAIVNAGGPSGLNIDLLHSESSSSGAGSSYLLSINGNTIGSSGQVNGQCQIPLSPLLVINCLTSTGGVANNITTSGADVVTATLGPGSQQSLTAKLIDSNTKSGIAPPAVNSGNGAQTGGSGSGAGTGSGNGAATAPSGALAFTGLDAVSLLALALALGLGGTGLVWWARRSRVSAI